MNISKRKNIVIIGGGHHTPALAVLNKMRQMDFFSSFNFHWFGKKHTLWRDANPSLEYQEVEHLEVPFYDIKAGKLYRTYNPLKLARIPFGFVQSFILLLRLRPKLIISFGGYLAVPVVFAGWLLGIKSVTHEQTVVSGWANRFIAFFAKKIFISWKDSLAYFPDEKASFVGLPVRQDIVHPPSLTDLEKKDSQLANFIARAKDSPDRLVYITGGKQGSHIINQVVEEALDRLLSNYWVIHQTGHYSQTKDFTRLSERAKGKKRYLVRDYLASGVVGGVMKEADVVVGRSGANTVYELAVLAKPSILIPIPWVSHNEQMKNATYLVRHQAALIIKEGKFTGQTLVQSLGDLFGSFISYQKNAQKVSSLVSGEASDRMASEISQILKFS